MRDRTLSDDPQQGPQGRSPVAGAETEAEARYRAIFEHAGVGMAELDTNDRLIAVNDRLCEILGYQRRQLLGRHVHELTHPDDRARSEQYNAEIHAGIRSRAVYDKRYLRYDGTPVWVHVTVSAVFDPQGRWQRSIATIEDISQRKLAEADLQAARGQADAALLAAEAAGRAKDHFIAVLSHELRTPLTPILATATLLGLDSQLPARYRQDVELIRRNVELEARLIDDLLDVTRIIRGKLELDRQAVALAGIIDRAVEVCRVEIEARQLQFACEMNDVAGVLVDADAARLQQVFWNLLKNSIKFTPPGGTLAVHARREGADHAIVEVRDSGVGIAPDVLPRLFNAFEQGGAGTTRQFGGLGLGLTITRGLLEMHGGSIVAHSEGHGCGATFRVTLPVAPSQRPLAAELNRRESPRAARPLRILLVEDHADTAHIMRRVLRAQGHDVSIAGDVTTALHLIHIAPREFELIVSDLGLPDFSGIQLMRMLRQKGLGTVGIALSGYGQEEDVRRSLEAGFAAHLIKPTNPLRLAQTIAQVMGAAPASALPRP